VPPIVRNKTADVLSIGTTFDKTKVHAMTTPLVQAGMGMWLHSIRVHLEGATASVTVNVAIFEDADCDTVIVPSTQATLEPALTSGNDRKGAVISIDERLPIPSGRIVYVLLLVDGADTPDWKSTDLCFDQAA
jgi:hypothetical protein